MRSVGSLPLLIASAINNRQFFLFVSPRFYFSAGRNKRGILSKIGLSVGELGEQYTSESAASTDADQQQYVHSGSAWTIRSCAGGDDIID